MFVRTVWAFKQCDMNLILFEKCENGVLSFKPLSILFLFCFGFADDAFHMGMKPICNVNWGIRHLGVVVGGRLRGPDHPSVCSLRSAYWMPLKDPLWTWIQSKDEHQVPSTLCMHCLGALITMMFFRSSWVLSLGGSLLFCEVAFTFEQSERRVISVWEGSKNPVSSASCMRVCEEEQARKLERRHLAHAGSSFTFRDFYLTLSNPLEKLPQVRNMLTARMLQEIKWWGYIGRSWGSRPMRRLLSCLLGGCRTVCWALGLEESFPGRWWHLSAMTFGRIASELAADNPQQLQESPGAQGALGSFPGLQRAGPGSTLISYVGDSLNSERKEAPWN